MTIPISPNSVKAITPNLHNLARNFVDLDNFYDRSEVSMDGWPWTTSARAPDVVEKQTSANYAGCGVSYDSEGANRNVNVSYPTLAQRLAADPCRPTMRTFSPARSIPAAPDGPNNRPNTGYLWNDAVRAGPSIRNYGFFIGLARYNLPARLHRALHSRSLANTTLPIPASLFAGLQPLKPTHDAFYRGRSHQDMNFSTEDRIDFDKYNHIMWKGMMGNKPYPETRSGLDLRVNRNAILHVHSTNSSSVALPGTGY